MGELIQIYDKGRNNTFERLSITWYDKTKHNPQELTKLGNALREYLRRGVQRYEGFPKAHAADIMWTCPKKYNERLSGKGYTITRGLTAEEMSLSDTEKEKLTKKLSCYVPSNARATNDYRERWALAYCMECNIDPEILKLLHTDENTFGKDRFALSAMLQWIFRSRVRDGDKVIVYVPSDYCRKLLYDWLNP